MGKVFFVFAFIFCAMLGGECFAVDTDCKAEIYDNYDYMSSCQIGDDSNGDERFIYTYLDDSDDTYYARVATVVSGSVVLGSATSWGSFGCFVTDMGDSDHESDTHAVAPLDTSTFMLVYREADTGTNEYMVGVVGTVSNTGASASISFDTTNQCEYDEGPPVSGEMEYRFSKYNIDVEALSSTKVIVFGRQRASDTYEARAMSFILNVTSGSTVTVGSSWQQYIPDDCPDGCDTEPYFLNRSSIHHVVKKLTSSSVIMSYSRGEYGSTCRFIVGNVGDTIPDVDRMSWGDQAYLEDSSNDKITDVQSRDIVVLDSSRFAVVYRGDDTDLDETHAIRVVIGEIDGSDDITFGDIVDVTDEVDTVFDPDCYECSLRLPKATFVEADNGTHDGKFMVSFTNETHCGAHGAFYMCTVTNGTDTTVTCDSTPETMFDNTDDDVAFDDIYLLDSDDILAVYRQCDVDNTPDCAVAVDILDDSTLEECAWAIEPDSPHDAKKNRYVSFSVDNPLEQSVAFKISMTDSELFSDDEGDLGYIGEPNDDGLSRVVSTPYYADDWPEVIHVGDCCIVPRSEYEISGTLDNSSFGTGVEIETAEQPGAKEWCDVVGAFVTGVGWAPPEGNLSMNDLVAIMQSMSGASTAPHWTWTDVHPEIPNGIINMSDTQVGSTAFTGADYPYTFCEE